MGVREGGGEVGLEEIASNERIARLQAEGQERQMARIGRYQENSVRSSSRLIFPIL